MMAIGLNGVQLSQWSYKWLTKSGNCKTRFKFVNHEYNYRQNLDNMKSCESKLRQYLRKKLDIH